MSTIPATSTSIISSGEQSASYTTRQTENTTESKNAASGTQSNATNFSAKDILSLSDQNALFQALSPIKLTVVNAEGTALQYNIGDADQTLAFRNYLAAKQNGDTLELSSESLARFQEIEKNGVVPKLNVRIITEENLGYHGPGIMTSEERVAQKDWDDNPQNRWAMKPGAEAFAGHDILKTAYPGASIDDYGYSYTMPALYIQRPTGIKTPTWTYQNEKGETVNLMIDKNGKATDAKGNVVELTGKEGLGKSVPEITAFDQVNLGGLSLDERKTFLDGVQKLLDDNGYGMFSSREFRYGLYGNGSMYGINGNGFELSVEMTEKMQEAIQNDKTLSQLAAKSYDYKKSYGYNYNNVPLNKDNFVLKVLDDQGNRIANDQIIVATNDGSRQMQMSVEEFSQNDRLQIYKMLLGV